jgi:hypothetical protein
MRQSAFIIVLLLLASLPGIKAQDLTGTVSGVQELQTKVSDARKLSGKVTDTRGEPLAYASVYIAELRQGTTTNREGLYELSIPSGTYTVNYQFLGYTPSTEKIEIGDNDVNRDITLSEQFYEIPAVRVSASGRDPAYFIMRKAIGMAPFHLNQVKMYRAEVYIKGG